MSNLPTQNISVLVSWGTKYHKLGVIKKWQGYSSGGHKFEIEINVIKVMPLLRRLGEVLGLSPIFWKFLGFLAAYNYKLDKEFSLCMCLTFDMAFVL